MIIKSVTFEVEIENEELLKKKITKDLTSLKKTETCLSVEAWRQKNKQIVAYTLVSKWATKKEFQEWLKRPDHLQQHRQAHSDKEKAPSKISRTKMEEFEMFDLID